MFSLESKSEKMKELESLLNNKNIYSIVEENRTIILVNDTSINEKNTKSSTINRWNNERLVQKVKEYYVIRYKTRKTWKQRRF